MGNIRTKRMFEADCLFLNGTMIAIVVDNDIYIKKIHINDKNSRFGYLRKGKMIFLNYVLIDTILLNEQDALMQLVHLFINP